MSYIAAISDVTHPMGCLSGNPPSNRPPKSAYELAEKHIHATQPDDQIVPTDDRGEYAVWAQSDRVRSTRVATLTITATDDSPVAAHQTPGRATRASSAAATAVTTGAANTTVLAISFTAHGVLEFITVRDDQGARTHATGWDDRDEILFDPRVAHPDAGGPGADQRRQP